MKQYPMFKVHVAKAAALRNIEVVLDSGFINEGEQVIELQKRLGPLLGSENVVLTNAGTSALTMALKLCGIGHGDKVVSTPMTCVAGNTPIVNCQADIVWCDVDPASGMVTPETVAAALTDDTKAVMLVDWAGVPPELDAIHDLCKSRSVPLIQDAAHAFGAEYKGRPINHFADFTCFSFQAIKHFTCGDGGAIVCADDDAFALAKKLKWFGFDREAAKDAKGNWKGQRAGADILQNEVGYKFNMNNISAAIGLAQLDEIEGILARHRSNAALFDEIFENNDRFRPISRVDDCLPSFWVYTGVLSRDAPARDDVLKSLNDEGIHAGVVHVPNDDYAAFAAYKKELSGLDHFAAHQMSLPCGWWLDSEDIRHIAARMKAVIGG